MRKFSLVIYFDSELTKKIKGVQLQLYKITGSRACLDIWEPHLTIGSGIEVKQEELKDLCNTIKYITNTQKPITIEIKDFNFMENWPGGQLPGFTPYLVYLDIVVNEKLLALAELVEKTLTNKWKTWYTQPWPYAPHLTVAYKDLTKEGLKKAKELLAKETFKIETTVNHIALAEENSKGVWQEYARFNFQS